MGTDGTPRADPHSALSGRQNHPEDGFELVQLGPAWGHSLGSVMTPVGSIVCISNKFSGRDLQLLALDETSRTMQKGTLHWAPM